MRTSKKVLSETPAKVTAKMDKLRVADAISEIFTLFKRCNKYIDETEPWVLAKDEAKKDRLATVLYHLIEGIRMGAVLLQSFMPGTSEKNPVPDQAENCDLENLAFGQYVSGTKVVEKPEILFARLDLSEVMAQVEEKIWQTGSRGNSREPGRSSRYRGKTGNYI